MKLKEHLSWSMTPARAEKWRVTREKGKTRYILLVGVLGWGGSMTLGMSLFRYMEKPESFDWTQCAVLHLPIYLIGGFLFGVCTWAMAEKQYLQFKDMNG